MPKLQRPIEANLIINHLSWEAMVERQRETLDADDDTLHVPSIDPLSNPQSHCEYMLAEFKPIDEAIIASYQSASQVEMVRQLEARISKIGGASAICPNAIMVSPLIWYKSGQTRHLPALLHKIL